jgi:hypothetical protein
MFNTVAHRNAASGACRIAAPLPHRNAAIHECAPETDEEPP